jgi:transcriptional regulator with XRE-family HTH domain
MQPADINRICAALGLTQVQLARVLKVEPPTVSYWKAGRAVKSPATRGALAALSRLVEILEERELEERELTSALRQLRETMQRLKPVLSRPA